MSRLRVAISPDVVSKDGTPIFDPSVLALLDHPRIEWFYMTAPLPVVTPEFAATHDVICAMLERVTPRSFARGDHKMRLVARFGVGYDTIDVPSCTQAGVMLTLAPDGVRRPVATNVITFILVLAQKLLLKDRLTREGRWAEKTSHMGMGLTGRTLGVVGVGNIGAEVFRLAMPFEMKHIAYDPFANAAAMGALNVELVPTLDELMRRADFVSINCPLNDRTRGLIGPHELAQMKKTAFIINTARGPIIQEKALHEALAARRIAGAGLDVFEVEPTPRDNPILKLDNVVVTPHGLCYTDECFTGIARNTFEAVRALADGKPPKYVVNREALDKPALAALKS
ncbi:MAG: dehydrogenase [Alphaproteobacteria bacterium]|nr:dehydrogenase [Alphaproteobacteria bacterium]